MAISQELLGGLGIYDKWAQPDASIKAPISATNALERNGNRRDQRSRQGIPSSIMVMTLLRWPDARFKRDDVGMAGVDGAHGRTRINRWDLTISDHRR